MLAVNASVLTKTLLRLEVAFSWGNCSLPLRLSTTLIHREPNSSLRHPSTWQPNVRHVRSLTCSSVVCLTSGGHRHKSRRYDFKDANSVNFREINSCCNRSVTGTRPMYSSISNLTKAGRKKSKKMSTSPDSKSPSEPEIAEENSPSVASNPELALDKIIEKLEEFAPSSLAEEWDNVGLLVEPSPPHEVHKVFLTNDLTEEILEEAIKLESGLIISYHPPIFAPLKRLTMKTEKQRIIVRAIEKGVAIYSPHTAHDSVKGGVNDWLLSAFGNQTGTAISCSGEDKKYKLEIIVSKQFKQKVQEVFNTENGGHPKCEKKADGSYHFNVICDKETLKKLSTALSAKKVERNTQITKLYPDPCSETGAGRFLELAESVTVEDCVQKVKGHLELEHVQLALGKGKTMESSIQSVAVCAGSGGKVLAGVKADLYLTGEMSHHEILAAVSMGTSVITCNHSNTERGFLKNSFKNTLEQLLGENVAVLVSEVDADPLKVV